ncbi:MAG: glutamate racemase, partial [Snodgrassella alvi]|nr:glutamate racemase [Snodgrassella alvi]
DALDRCQLTNPNHTGAKYHFYVSDIPLRFQTIGERFLGRSLEQLEMVSLG